MDTRLKKKRAVSKQDVERTFEVTINLTVTVSGQWPTNAESTPQQVADLAQDLIETTRNLQPCDIVRMQLTKERPVE